VVDDLVITTEVDPLTNEPIGDQVFVWEDDPESLVSLWIAIHVEGFSAGSRLSITVYQDGVEYGSREVPLNGTTSGWVATIVRLDTPSLDAGDFIYTVSTFVNDQHSLDTSFQVSSISGP